MSIETTVADVVVGIETPLVLGLFPLAVVALWVLIVRGDGTASLRSRYVLFGTRLLVAALIVLAAAGPYTLATRETAGDPEVRLLVDESDSMVPLSDVEELADRIEAAGVPVSVATVGNGTRSRVGDGIAANLRENGSVVVLSDGRVTEGRSLNTVADLARSLNATISSVDIQTVETERYVELQAPTTTSRGIDNALLARVGGVETEGAVEVTVTVGNETVATRTLADGTGTVTVEHTFNDTGSHRVTASINSSDRFDRNDEFHRTVEVVERPDVLYVSQGRYPLQSYLGELYDLDTSSSVPEDLSEYYAVVIQDTPADSVGDVETLQRFVIDGNGVVVVGGQNAFENGDYGGSSFGSMLPVTPGDSGPGTSNVVLAVDVSGSTEAGMQVQKAIALDVLDQLGDENTLGLVAFNFQPYAVAQPRPLTENRDQVRQRIRRLQSGGATSISTGLRGAADMLDGERGTVILISDGNDDTPGVAATARRLGQRGVQVITVGVGNRTNQQVLRSIARASGGSYLQAEDTDRLRLLFGGASRSYQGDGLTVVNPNAFITSGVTLESNPGRSNDVSVKRGADLLVATDDGTPAVASWRYGLGRAVTITAHGPRGRLNGLLQPPDALVVTKSVNHAIGDPQRKLTNVSQAGDTRVGVPTTVTYRSTTRPQFQGLSFSRVDSARFETSVTPRERGFHVVAGTGYAANYRTEYGGFGQSATLRDAVLSTGGQRFERSEATEIATFARQQSSGIREVRDEWDWVALLLAFIVFTAEILVRRVEVYRGVTKRQSGLP